jgi:hypothetical protein
MASTEEKKKTAPSYPELLDIPSVSLAEAREQIKLCLKYKQRRGCPVLVGESGLGKTQIYGQIAREMDYTVKPIHTAQYNLMGAGIPKKAEGQFFDIAVPQIFPKPGEKAIVLFDELNRGLKHAIALFFTMLEDGRIFDYRLPPDCIVAAAMNPADAAYSVVSLEKEPAIRRRVKFYWVEPNSTDWLRFAATEEFHYNGVGPAHNKPCHPDILAFFRARPKMVYDTKAKEAGKQYLCPATIETVSEDAYLLEDTGLSLVDETARNRFSASIGLAAMEQLTAYILDHTATVEASDVLYHPRRAMEGVRKLVENAQQEKLADLGENVLTIIFADMPKDVKEVAKNFLAFCKALPVENAASMCQQIRSHATSTAASNYLRDWMGALQHFDEWSKLQLAFDKAHRAINDAVKS